MDIECYGIRLVRLTAPLIEQVRLWRNRPDIVVQMEYQQPITAEMQQAWFTRIDNANHHYFLIAQNGQYGGLIHTAPVDWQMGEADTGLFLAETNWIDTPIPALASLAMVETFFENVGLKRLRAKVHQANTKALRYNASLGFVPVGLGMNPDFVLLELTPERFFPLTLKARAAAAKLYGGRKKLILSDSPLAAFSFQEGGGIELVF